MHTSRCTPLTVSLSLYLPPPPLLCLPVSTNHTLAGRLGGIALDNDDSNAGSGSGASGGSAGGSGGAGAGSTLDKASAEAMLAELGPGHRLSGTEQPLLFFWSSFSVCLLHPDVCTEIFELYRI